MPCVYDKILLLNISILGLKQLYEKVEFTHPAYIEPQNPTDKSRIHYVKGEDNTEENVVLSSEEAANKNRRAKIISATEASLQFPQISHIERRKIAGDKHETKKVFINKTRQEMFSTGPRVGDADATPVEMELIETEETVILEPGFETFGKVITKISKLRGTTNFSCHFFTLPDVIPIPDMQDGSKRKYALVKFEYYGKRVCITEICGVDFAISTLVVCGVDAEKGACKILKSLEGTNGHWNKNIIVMLSNMSKETRIMTLRHFDGRSVDKWTELIMKNIE